MQTAALSGRRIVVTGASRGIGLAIAHRLAELGAALVLVARDPRALDDARGDLQGGPHEIAPLDVTDDSSWHEVACRLDFSSGIDGLVSSAGVIGPIGPIGSWSVSEFRRTIEVNVVGTLLSVCACLEGLERSRGAVVTMSGGGATAPFPRFDAYATSKAAVVRLTENLAHDLTQSGVRFNTIAPGFVVTEMHDATLVAGPDAAGEEYYNRTKDAAANSSGDSPQLAADLAAFLLSDSAIGISGKLLSAKWDPWADASFLDRLRSEADFCTLRRIDAQYFDSVPQA
jgi:3-oxoacyl-[acyl-carrier protein] reductase